MKNIYGIANKFDTEEDLMTVLTCYRVNLIQLLKKGYSPFENNNELHKSLSSCNEQPDTLQSESNTEGKPTKENTLTTTENSSAVATRERTTATPNNPVITEDKEKSSQNTPKKTPPVATAQLTSVATGNTIPTLKEELAFALELKKQVISPRTLKDYTSSANTFIEWLKIHKSELQQASEINRMICIAYLNSIASRSSARNRNNHKVNLSILEKEHVLFTPKGLVKEWVAAVKSRRDYFSKRFKKIVKNTFNFDENYGLYSYRHTYVAKLYRQLIIEHATYAVKSKLLRFFNKENHPNPVNTIKIVNCVTDYTVE